MPENSATACYPNSLGSLSPPSEQLGGGHKLGYVTRLTKFFPKKLKGVLPSPEEIEAELSRKDGETIGR